MCLEKCLLYFYLSIKPLCKVFLEKNFNKKGTSCSLLIIILTLLALQNFQEILAGLLISKRQTFHVDPNNSHFFKYLWKIDCDEFSGTLKHLFFEMHEIILFD